MSSVFNNVIHAFSHIVAMNSRCSKLDVIILLSGIGVMLPVVVLEACNATHVITLIIIIIRLLLHHLRRIVTIFILVIWE